MLANDWKAEKEAEATSQRPRERSKVAVIERRAVTFVRSFTLGFRVLGAEEK